MAVETGCSREAGAMTELSETIELMQSEDYRERFKAEYWQTKIRAEKLRDLLLKYEKGTLPFTPKCSMNLLLRQHVLMTEYMYLLEKRAEIERTDLNGETAQ